MGPSLPEGFPLSLIAFDLRMHHSGCSLPAPEGVGGPGSAPVRRRACLDAEAFAADLTDGVHLDRIQGDVEGGMQSGVAGTPTFFINGLWN
jgi:2-hydroxychromene-2-carboxylate isomerase